MTREFGATAWGHAWLKRIEPVLSTGPPDRDLPRARALARRAVDDLTVNGPRVTARLTERAREHTIILDVPTWTREEQDTAARIIGRAETSRGGDLPNHIVTELTWAGIRVAPGIADISATSDTGQARRRHVLAACYALVQKIDEEPLLAVRLRTPPETAPSTGKEAFLDALPLANIDPGTFYDGKTRA